MLRILSHVSEYNASTRGRGSFRRPACSALMLALALGIAGGVPAQAAPADQDSTILDVEYVMDAGPKTVELCVGDTEDIYVTVALVVTEQIGSEPPFDTNEYYPGEEVKALVRPENAGSAFPYVMVSGPLPPRQTQLGSYMRWSGSNILRFEFTAERAGSAIVEFTHLTPKKRLTPARPQRVDVTARDCYAAIQSAMATEFTKKYICDLKQPYVLEGTIPLGAAGTVESTAEFTPFPDDPLNGSFVFKARHSTDGCLDLAGGRYTVKLKPWKPLPTSNEGNIIFSGAGISICPYGQFPIQNIGYEIKILPDALNDCEAP